MKLHVTTYIPNQNKNPENSITKIKCMKLESQKSNEDNKKITLQVKNLKNYQQPNY